METKDCIWFVWILARDLSHDRGIGVLMGLPDFSECLEQLPSTALQAEQWALRKFGLDQGVWADYLEALLLTVNGWASWCSYLSWQAKLEGTTDDALRDLLAIRLAWGAILLDSCSAVHAEAVFKKLRSDWNRVPDKDSSGKSLNLKSMRFGSSRLSWAISESWHPLCRAMVGQALQRRMLLV